MKNNQDRDTLFGASELWKRRNDLEALCNHVDDYAYMRFHEGKEAGLQRALELLPDTYRKDSEFKEAVDAVRSAIEAELKGGGE